MMDQELYSAETVETLKIEEEETYERPSSRRRRRRHAHRHETRSAERKRGLLPIVLIVAIIWMLSTGVLGGGTLLGLVLLFPFLKNWQRVRQDRASGIVSHQTHKALRGAMFAGLFAFMFIFNAWGAFLPLLLIGLGVTALTKNRWKRELVYY